jgi:hypothetical protein
MLSSFPWIGDANVASGNLISAKIHQHLYMYIRITEYSYTCNRAKTASNDNHVTKAVEILYKEPTGMKILLPVYTDLSVIEDVCNVGAKCCRPSRGSAMPMYYW